MRKLDWSTKQEYARRLTVAELKYAYLDAVSAALKWDETPSRDPEGNAGYYHDEASVYRAELASRGVGFYPKPHDLAAHRAGRR